MPRETWEQTKENLAFLSDSLQPRLPILSAQAWERPPLDFSFYPLRKGWTQ